MRVKPGQFIEIEGEEGGSARTLRIERQPDGLRVEVVDGDGEPHGVNLRQEDERYVGAWMAGL